VEVVAVLAHQILLLVLVVLVIVALLIGLKEKT
jgi:hypothetical protein